MMFKSVFIFAALSFCSFFFIQTIKAQRPSFELKEAVPQVEEKLNSEDLPTRIAVLEKLVVYERDYDVTKTILPFNLSADDYAYVIRKIFEKDLAQIDVKLASQTLSRIEFLMRKFKLKEFSKNLVEYIPKYVPNGMDFPRIGIQYGILGALEALQAKEFAPQIALLLQTPIKHLYRETLDTLVELRAKESVPALASLLYDKNYQERYYALQSLIKVNGRGAAPSIAKLLDDENANNRYWALDALVKLNIKNFKPQIWKLIESGQNPTAESYAIAALIAFGDERAIPPAIARITDADDDRRNEMLRRIIETNATAIIPSLIVILENDAEYLVKEGENSHVRMGVINALEALQAREAIPVLRDYVRSKRNDFLQAGAVIALGKLSAREAVDDLLPLLNQNATGNAAYDAASAALALAQIGERRTWQQLIDFAANPNCPAGSQIVIALNRHINPQLWQKTVSIKIKGIDYKSIKTNADSFSAESGISIVLDFQPNRDKSRRKPLDESGYPWMRAGNEMSLYDGLQEIVRTIDDGTLPQTFTFIFDDNQIRLLPVGKAIDWWRAKIIKKELSKNIK